jgi:hypothetical protein
MVWGIEDAGRPLLDSHTTEPPGFPGRFIPKGFPGLRGESYRIIWWRLRRDQRVGSSRVAQVEEAFEPQLPAPRGCDIRACNFPGAVHLVGCVLVP